MGKDQNKMLKSILYVVFLNTALICGLLFLLHSADTKRDSIDDIRREISLYEKRIESVTELKKVLSDTSSWQAEVKSVFLGKESMVNFIEELEYLSENSNLVLDMKGVSMPDEKSSKDEKPRFSFSASGAFPDIYKYVALLENDKYQVVFEKVNMQNNQESEGWKASIDLQLMSYQDEI